VCSSITLNLTARSDMERATDLNEKNRLYDE